MYLTSVLLVINENFDSVDTIKDNLKYAGSRVELVVYNNHCQNEEIVEQMKVLSTKYISNFTPIEYSFSECINELFRIASGEFICIIQDYSLFCEDWLKSLIDSHNLIRKSGVISLNDWSTSEIAYHLDINDNLTATYSEDGRVNGIPFFKKELLYTIGGFDPKLNELFCIWDFCDRVTINGYYNYFVPDTSMIKETGYIDSYFTNKADYLKTISLRSKETFFPIFQPTELTPIVIESLKKKIPCSIQYSQKLGAIVFAKDNLNSSDIIVLASILKEYNLDLDLLPSSLFEQTILKSSLIGIIR